MNFVTNLKRFVRPSARGADARDGNGAASSADNRAAPRLRRFSTAQLLHYPAARHQHPINVQVTDYSSTGIGVIHNEGLLIGKTFVVREPHVTDKNTCLFTVVRCDARADGTYSIGLHVGNSLGNEHDPLLEIPPAPGISWTSKILFFVFAILGGAMLIVGLWLKQHAN